MAMKFGIMTHFNPLKPCGWQKFDLTKTADGRCLDIPWSIYSKRLSEGQNRYDADAYRVRIGAAWRRRLIHPCAAAMRPYVKLFWPLVIITAVTLFIIVDFSTLFLSLVLCAQSDSDSIRKFGWKH